MGSRHWQRTPGPAVGATHKDSRWAATSRASWPTSVGSRRTSSAPAPTPQQPPRRAPGGRRGPVSQTTPYVFRDTEHAASLFNMERAGHVYSRIANPTVAVLEERIAALEGGVGVTHGY